MTSSCWRPAITAAAWSKTKAPGSFYSLFYDWCQTLGTASRSGNGRSMHTIATNGSRRSSVPNSCSSSVLGSLSRRIMTQTPEPQMSTDLRRLMRRMPHSVVVATASLPASQKRQKPEPKGMTLSSFTTLTLTPEPIVTFNIRKPSSTLDAIRESGEFVVHILSATNAGMRVAQAFARGNQQAIIGNPEYGFLKLLEESPVETEPPVLQTEGVMKALRCKVLGGDGGRQGLVEVGDHTMVLAKVLRIHDFEPGDAVEQLEHGLLYVDGQYCELGPPLQ